MDPIRNINFPDAAEAVRNAGRRAMRNTVRKYVPVIGEKSSGTARPVAGEDRPGGRLTGMADGTVLR
jgi:hypothetical protein